MFLVSFQWKRNENQKIYFKGKLKIHFFGVSINNESCIIALHQMVTKGNSNYKRYTCIARRGIAFTDPLSIYMTESASWN